MIECVVEAALQKNKEDGASWQRAMSLCEDAQTVVGVRLSPEEVNEAVGLIYSGLDHG
jgi:hypothetical protein